MKDSFHSSPTILLSLFKDSQGFSHSFNRLCRIMLFSMEISVPQVRAPETSHTPKAMARTKANPKLRKALIVTIVAKPITLLLKHRITMIFNLLRTTPERAKVASLSRMTPTIPGISERKGIILTSSTYSKVAPKGLRCLATSYHTEKIIAERQRITER